MSQKNLVGCPICKGKKQLIGLGSFPENCYYCKGIGWIEEVTEKDEDEFLGKNETVQENTLTDTDTVVKKRGRPSNHKPE